MTTPIHFHETTTATPERYVAGLTDFGPGRAELFGNSADDYLEVHDMGATEADVTEGSGGVWERLHYKKGSTPDEASAAAGRHMAEVKHVVVSPA